MELDGAMIAPVKGKRQKANFKRQKGEKKDSGLLIGHR